MLPSDEQLAIGKIYRQADKLSAAYTECAELAAGQMSELFADLAASRARVADEALECARELGAPKEEASQERAALERVENLVNATAAVRLPDPDLVNERLADEALLEVALNEALEVELNLKTEAFIADWKRTVSDARDRLRLLKQEPDEPATLRWRGPLIARP